MDRPVQSISSNVDHAEPAQPINNSERKRTLNLEKNKVKRCETKRKFSSRDHLREAMSLLLLLAIVFPAMASSSSLPADESCGPEVAVLKRSIKKLEDRLFFATWQVEHLQRHKFLRPLQSTVVSDTKPDSEIVPAGNNNSSSSGILDDSDTTAIKLIPPAGNLIVHDKDCSELFDRLKPPSGFYRIRPKSHQDPFLVYCDMEDGGGWTVFQKRRHGRVDFNRDWVDYKDGFGDFKLWNDEFWLGNDHIHSLLSEGRNLVKIDLMDWNGQKNHAFYDNFRISDEADKYRLQYKMYSGKAGDALTGRGGMVEHWSTCLSGMQFSTRDQDNDRYLQGSCAQENEAGWWFNRCHGANLNGKFYRTGKYKGKYDNGVVWGTWKGLWYSLRHTTMKVRPLLFLDAEGSGAGEI